MKNLLESILLEFVGDRKRVEHTMKVFAYSRLIGTDEGLTSAQMEILETAALLHDIGIPAAMREYGSAAGPYQEKTGERITRELLSRIRPEITEDVAFLVGHHHSFELDGGNLLRILFEADFLVNFAEGNVKIETIRTVRQQIFRSQLAIMMLESMFREEFKD